MTVNVVVVLENVTVEDRLHRHVRVLASLDELEAFRTFLAANPENAEPVGEISVGELAKSRGKPAEPPG